jgi:hypothetical protein
MFKVIYVSSAIIFTNLFSFAGAVPRPEPQVNPVLHTYVLFILASTHAQLFSGDGSHGTAIAITHLHSKLILRPPSVKKRMGRPWESR